MTLDKLMIPAKGNRLGGSWVTRTSIEIRKICVIVFKHLQESPSATMTETKSCCAVQELGVECSHSPTQGYTGHLDSRVSVVFAMHAVSKSASTA